MTDWLIFVSGMALGGLAAAVWLAFVRGDFGNASCRHDRGHLVPGTSEDTAVCTACSTMITIPHHRNGGTHEAG
jgi:hypothetical protein